MLRIIKVKGIFNFRLKYFNGTDIFGAYVQFRGSEFHTRNARFRHPQEQRRAKAHSRQAKANSL